MNRRDQLHAYITELEKRLRLGTVLRGVAIFTVGALVATLVLVLIANARAFSSGSVTASRFALIVILALAAGAGLALPLRRLTRRRAVETAESAFPQFEQRLTTFSERDGQDPFIELLAGDTLDVARSAEPEQMVTDQRLWISAGCGVGAFAILIWMIAAGPGFLGYGASLLWTGPHKPAIYDLRVTPGDAVVRRHADQVVSALPVGMHNASVKIYAKFASSGKWEQIPMQPQSAGSFAGGYQFVFAGLPENVEYYVSAGPMMSKHYNIRVTDLPSVKQLRVTYHYPAWTGMPPETEERGGDLRAVIGTEADVDVVTDRPLPGGQIQLDSGQKIQLSGGENNVYHGKVKLDQDGAYHVAGLEGGVPVRISEDFFIEAHKAEPPQIGLIRPGRGDYHASPIEEVTLTARATDEYGLNAMTLHYSVNGGPELTQDVLPKKGAKTADGSTTLTLENYKLQPGDLVSVYATAKDGNSEGHTDMIFIQADPFERSFSQSQAGGGGGGGGGGGNQAPEISMREKEIIAQTFKQQADKTATAQQAADMAKLLSESQATLHDQAVTLSGRLQARELTTEMQGIADFQKAMIAASNAMQPAAQSLQKEGWKDAIPNEQKALQYLLRAEATFREIQVAFGQQGGGGGGGGAARDLAALFDLELDTEKNQYETRKSAATSEEQKEQEIADALKKLDELAKREEDLAQQQRNGQQTAEQKWQQEMLQREAEQLRKQMEQQLAQNSQQGQPGQQQGQQSQQGGQQSGQQSSGQGSPGQSASNSSGGAQGQPGMNEGMTGSQQAQAAGDREKAAEQALDRLRQAADDMKRAASQNASSADARRAADRLRQATDLLGGVQQQDASGRLNAMAQEAEKLTESQKKQADNVRQLLAGLNADRAAGKTPKYPTPQTLDQMVNDRQQVSDEFARLQQQMRTAARELAPTQPGATDKLRGALDRVDEADLGTLLQRSSDHLRSGSFNDSEETMISMDLQTLGQQIRDAQHALGTAQQAGAEEAAINHAMDDLTRLRDQLGNLGGQPNRQPGQGSQPGQGNQPGQGRGGQQQFQGDSLGRNGQQGGNAQGVPTTRKLGQQGGNAQGDGQIGNGFVGDPGGGGDRRLGYGGMDTGNNAGVRGRVVTPSNGPTLGDTQRDIDQGLSVLNQMRPAVKDSPEARIELQQLIDQMRSLDPSRFPGNPALVEQMHQQLVSGVDALELQLRRKLDAGQSSTIRNPDPAKVPAGYRDSVAEYYRKLSGGSRQ